MLRLCSIAFIALGWLLPDTARAQTAPSLPGCPGAIDRQGVAMGTRIHLIVCPKDAGSPGEQAARSAAEAAFAEFGRLEGLWTTWLPHSDVSRINSAAGKKAVPVAAETLEVLQAAQRGSELSKGLFDITFAPLGDVWRFDTPPGSHAPTRLVRIPTEQEVTQLLQRVGWKHLHLDARHRTARLDRAGMAIHLGGIGKGAGVDRAVLLLRSKGFVDFAVQAGGDLYCAGHNGERPWRIGVAHPRTKDASLGSLDVTDAAFSTSGDYERFAILDGKRYHHILDPRTGFPATASQAVTVLASSATQAEVLTKTTFILGAAEGLAWLEAAGARGLVVDADGKLWQSKDLGLRAP